MAFGIPTIDQPLPPLMSCLVRIIVAIAGIHQTAFAKMGGHGRDGAPVHHVVKVLDDTATEEGIASVIFIGIIIAIVSAFSWHI